MAAAIIAVASHLMFLHVGRIDTFVQPDLQAAPLVQVTVPPFMSEVWDLKKI